MACSCVLVSEWVHSCGHEPVIVFSFDSVQTVVVTQPLRNFTHKFICDKRIHSVDFLKGSKIKDNISTLS